MELNISWTIESTPITSAVFVAEPGPFRSPVPAGTRLGHIEVQPAGWHGARAVTGADGAMIAVNDALEVITAQILTEARAYSATVSLLP